MKTTYKSYNSVLTQEKPTHLVVIDEGVEEYQELIAGVKPGTIPIVLNKTEDGIAQITAILEEYRDLATIHIVSHGSPGTVGLGNSQLNITALEKYRAQIKQWGKALKTEGAILLYGCRVAAEGGINLLKQLKQIVGVEIAASSTLTGNESVGGDWNLDFSTGKRNSNLAFEAETLAAYTGVLAEGEEPILAEDFSEASGSTAPTGWSIEVLEGNPETDSWRFDNPGERSQLESFEPFEGNFAVYDSDALSDDGLAESIVLESPVFDASDSEELYLLFDQYYGGIATGDFASQVYVEASPDGENWSEVYFSNTGTTLTNSPTLDLTETLAGEENAQVRFRFDGNWSFLWAVDNVEVYDFLSPGVTLPLNDVGVSEDDVPDPLSFQFALESRPTAPVTLSFDVDGEQLGEIESLTFTPENWFEPQTSVVTAIDDGIDEGNDQISMVEVTIESEDSNYDGLEVEDVAVQITDNAIPGFTSYRTVEKTYEDLSTLAEANSDIASWVDIGDSYDKVTEGGAEGYDIYSIELTNKNNGIEDKPTLYVQGAIHAREYVTTETVTRFAEELVDGYGSDADITWLLDYYKVAIVPIVNPDGRKFAEQGYSWRRNTNPNPPEGEEPAAFPNYGVDLNRNFSGKWGEIPGGSSGNPASNTYRGSAPFSEPETQAVRDYVTALFPDQKGPGDFDRVSSDATGIFLDVHSFGNLFLYPYGWTDLPAANKKELETLGRKFGYFSGTDGEAYDVKQSIGLYPTDGNTTTWAYGELGLAAYTFELGNTFFQDVETYESTIYPEMLPTLMYAAKAAYRPYQTPAGPETIEVSTDIAQAVAGVEVVINATADDTRYNDGSETVTDSGEEPVQNIAQARYSIDSPSWIEGTEFFSLESADGDLDSSVEELTATIDTSELAPGRHTIFIESQDANGNFGVPTAVFLDVIDFNPEAEVTKGSDQAELIEGSEAEEVLYGLGGDDTVFGRMGDDLIFGNAGDDVLRGEGNRLLPTGNEGGNDMIYGGDGNDYVDGKGGDDTLYGEMGDDYILGNVGSDMIVGGYGNDTLAGDDLYSTSGEDTFVLASEGTDVILDFTVGSDLIELPEELTFGQVTITQDRQDTLIETEEMTIAVLRDVDATTVDESSFSPA